MFGGHVRDGFLRQSLQLVVVMIELLSACSRRLRGLVCRTHLGALGAITAAALTGPIHATAADPHGNVQANLQSLEAIFRGDDLVVLADVKHGVRERIAFFSSPELFAAMARSGVHHVAIEMPRVLGRQASTIETVADVDAFARDVIRSGRWHFTDPDHSDETPEATQYRVAAALGQQVLLAKRYGMEVIAYDFNNPLGHFRTLTDPVYRCLAQLDDITWVKYGLDNKVTKDERDAAIMRERLGHDDELAAHIVGEVNASGGGKLVVMSGYAHAAIPNGIASRLEHRLHTRATVVAVFRDQVEQDAFHTFLWEQSRLLSIDLTRPPHFNFSIAHNVLRKEGAPGRYAALDGSRERNMPAVCFQLALTK